MKLLTDLAEVPLCAISTSTTAILTGQQERVERVLKFSFFGTAIQQLLEFVMFAGVSCVRMRFVLGLVLVVLWSATSSGFNIDTQQPIVRAPPLNHMDQEYDLFGYESVLHSRRVNTPSTTTTQSLEDTV